MSKKARDHRARTRRENRYLVGRGTAEDLDIDTYGWNRTRQRSLHKWMRQKGQLLFWDELTYLNWLAFGLEQPLVKGNK